MDNKERRQEHFVSAQAQCVGLLNQLEAVLCGWVLQHDREKVAKQLGPLYDLLDTDEMENA